MAFLDALTILGAGLGRGYRGSQALQRELSEQRRKALLEERDQATRERLAQSQIGLESARAAELVQAGELARFNLEEGRRRSLGGRRRLLPEGRSFKARLLGNELDIEPTYENLFGGEVPNILREIIGQQGATEREKLGINARITYPEFFGGRRQYLSPEDEALIETAQRFYSKSPPSQLGFDEEAMREFENRQLQGFLNMISRSPRLKALFSDTTSTTRAPVDPLGIE